MWGRWHASHRVVGIWLVASLLVVLWPMVSVKASTFVVTNTNDSGSGSLRDAIAQADVSMDAVTITFNIPGAGVHRIAPNSILSYVLKPMTIDATTQPGYAGTPLIELYGGNAGGTGSAFVITGGGSTIKGFILDGWYGGGGTGINIASDGNTIQNNFIGTDPTGSTAIANGTGILIAPTSNTGSASNNVIGGTSAALRNVVSGNTGEDIVINGATGGSAVGNVIQGNYVGLNAAGTVAVRDGSGNPSNGSGIDISAGSYNTVGGTAPGARNVIAGNSKGAGILINGQTGNAIGNVVQGNYIGTDVNGQTGIANNLGVYLDTAKNTIVGGASAAARNVISASNQDGVVVDGSFDSRADGNSATGNLIQGNYIGTDVTGRIAVGNNNGVTITAANSNTVGGTAPGTGNLIAGNLHVGVTLESVRDTTQTNGTVSNNVVQGNLIGTDITGMAPLGTPIGVAINGGINNTIGGTTPAARNVIAAFAQAGFLLFRSLSNATTTGNLIYGNYIGTGSDGATRLSTTQNTCVYLENANGNHIGDTTAGAGNVIAYGQRGVSVVTSNNDSILGNSIFGHAVLAIDLISGNGNNLEAAPTLSGARASGPNQITVTGSLSSTGTAPFRIEFFSTPTATAQGVVFLGATNTNGGAFSAPVAAATPGQYVTATATDAQGNTSQFSNAQIVQAGPPASVTPNPGTTPQSVVAGNAFAPLAVTVRDANGFSVGAGVTVTFTAPGGSGASGTFANGTNTIQVQTGANGVASAAFTGNQVGGTYQVTASVPGATSATFVLTNAPRPQPSSHPTAIPNGMPNLGPPPHMAQPMPGQPLPQPQRH